jgi:hypothetical protein
LQTDEILKILFDVEKDEVANKDAEKELQNGIQYLDGTRKSTM